ncbi:unnamed protein product, partial [marine sediment metagenome]
DELYLEYHRGTYTTQSDTKKWNRDCEVHLSNAEQLAALASLYGKPYPHKDFENAWRGVLFNQFHDILPGSSINPVYKDSDEMYKQSQQIANHQIDTSITHLSKLINTRAGKNALPVFIYNSLPWERTDIVSLQLPADDQRFYAVFDDKGRELPSQTIPGGRYHQKILFIARDIPAMGYAIYELRPGKASPRPSSLKALSEKLENDFFLLIVDTSTGWIQSIFDKRNSRKILAGYGNQLQLFEDKPEQWDAWNIGLGKRFPSTFREIKLVESG